MPFAKMSMAADTPRISVITPVRNGEQFLAETVASILRQTFGDFEYLIVDDASTDGTPEMIARFARQDARIVPLWVPTNVNQSHALNVALDAARGELVALIDADDLAFPERLACQVRFLDAHPEVGVVGAQVQQIDVEGNARFAMSFPTTPALVRWMVLFGTPVLHSAAMMRRALLASIGGYSVQWKYANDYSLWAELIERTQITNLPETLVAYRRHGSQMSTTLATPQRGEVWLLIHRMLAERLALRVSLDDIGALYHGVRGMSLEAAASLVRTADLLTTIWTRYLAVEQPDPATADAIAADCARRLLTMVWTHRRSARDASRVLLQRAQSIDPELWQRPQTCAHLRRLGIKHAASTHGLRQ